MAKSTDSSHSSPGRRRTSASSNAADDTPTVSHLTYPSGTESLSGSSRVIVQHAIREFSLSPFGAFRPRRIVQSRPPSFTALTTARKYASPPAATPHVPDTDTVTFARLSGV